MISLTRDRADWLRSPGIQTELVAGPWWLELCAGVNTADEGAAYIRIRVWRVSLTWELDGWPTGMSNWS